MTTLHFKIIENNLYSCEIVKYTCLFILKCYRLKIKLKN